MNGEVLVDTNVLVYAYDRGATAKQGRALDVLRRLVGSGKGRLSAQVLGEFFQVVTRKIPAPLSAAEAWAQVAALIRSWSVIPVTPLIALEAARGVRDHRLSYWDAQVWATARLNQISLILSEDFTDGHVLEGVRFLDPFALAFDPAVIG